jgi:hypothetical protein
MVAVAAATVIFLPNSSASSSTSVLKLLTFFLLLLGLFGLYAHQSEAAGPLGLVGCQIAFLGTLLLSGDLWLEAFAFPYFREVAHR